MCPHGDSLPLLLDRERGRGMNAIMGKPKTIPCPRCFGLGRVWNLNGEPAKAGHEETPEQELIRHRMLYANGMRQWEAKTIDCPDCGGSGEIPYPELKS